MRDDELDGNITVVDSSVGRTSSVAGMSHKWRRSTGEKVSQTTDLACGVSLTFCTLSSVGGASKCLKIIKNKAGRRKAAHDIRWGQGQGSEMENLRWDSGGGRSGAAGAPKGRRGGGGAQCMGANSCLEELSKLVGSGAISELRLASAVRWTSVPGANRLARSRARNTCPGPEMHPPLTYGGSRTAQHALRHE